MSHYQPLSPYGRFAIFIDGSNFYYTARDLGLHVDYRRLLDLFRLRGELFRAYYYTTILENGQSPDWLIRLVDWLSYNGYSVHTKRGKVHRRQVKDDYGDEHWVTEVKGSINLEITVDILTIAPTVDTIILFSGNGDLVPVIEAVQPHCRVIIVSSERTQESTVADELRRKADEFIDVDAIASEIARADRQQ